VLTALKAYSSWPSAPKLLLDDESRPETDLLQIRNIDGLNPVKASVNTSPFGSVDGAAYIGSNVPTRNIVLTVHPNPDWNIWTYESLRRLIYSYFMPKLATRLDFYSDDLVPVTITGIVEDVGLNQFSKDPEFLVSVICPNPYFTSLEPHIITGQSIRADGDVVHIEYAGNIETGIHVEVTAASGPDPTSIGVQIGDPSISYFNTEASVAELQYFEMNSVPMEKFVQNVDIGGGTIINLLPKVQPGSSWPILKPGENDFSVITDTGIQDWELRYFDRFGGL